MDEKLKKLKVLLDDLNYPSVYMYKFIVKTDEKKINQIKLCFSETAEFELNPSKNGNYVSVSIKEMMLNSDDIIARYQSVAKIKDVITL